MLMYLALGCSRVGERGLHTGCWESELTEQKILPGQTRKKEKTDETFLITRIYSEVCATHALLLKIDGEERLRDRVQKAGDSLALPGFTHRQDAQPI